MRVLLVPAGLLVFCGSALQAQGTPATPATPPTPAAPAAPAAQAAPLKWGPAPASFPAGANMAVVSGDPSKPGLFTIRLSMPDGYRIPPHFHPTDEAVEVTAGTFSFGMGDAFDAAKMQTLTVGQKGALPANPVSRRLNCSPPNLCPCFPGFLPASAGFRVSVVCI